MSIRIHFLGAAETVTGSKYLIEALGKRILIDCGLFQGLKKLRLINWAPFPIDPSTIDAVLLTHGHLDHCGYLPRLVAQGLSCPIYGTEPSLEIARIILEDSAQLQEEEARRANEEGYTKHSPAKPLYSLKDVEKTLPLFSPQKPGEWIPLGEEIRYRHRYAGHILGATFLELDVEGRRLLFSGDIGRFDDPLLYQPELPERADVLFLESTYGDRLHLKEDIQASLQGYVQQTLHEQGVLLIPSFAVERAQLLMYHFWQLRLRGAIPDIPIYLDSPMGADVTQLMERSSPWHKLSQHELHQLSRSISHTASYRDTLRLLDDGRPKVVIAGSGMATGGRILSYLARYISLPTTTVLLAGYQAEGTLGRFLLGGREEAKTEGITIRWQPASAACR
ncbi:MBL fold metallo-hydrolase, partial [Cesiribacter andamanensis]|uniref:MBL fold metallo-hydrolase n=1 Tax=Cesiribacter andamanensis TaxID=649507 RepID=UPI000590F2DD